MTRRLGVPLLLTLIGAVPALPTATPAPVQKAEEVTIHRDEFGVPNIFAATEEGAAFGHGYAQAEDRLEELRSRLNEAEQRAIAAEERAEAAAEGEKTEVKRLRREMDRRIRDAASHEIGCEVADPLTHLVARERHRLSNDIGVKLLPLSEHGRQGGRADRTARRSRRVGHVG